MVIEGGTKSRVSEKRSNYAGTLQKLSLEAFDMGSWAEAEKLAEESVKILQVLYAEDPKSYTSALAKSLRNLSHVLHRLDRLSEAQKTILEAIQLIRALYDLDSTLHCADLAAVLHTFAIYLSQSGLHSRAQDVNIETIRLRRILCRDDPTTHVPLLAQSLYNRAFDLSELGDHYAARDTMIEVIQLRRALFAADPTTYSPYLAQSLHNLAIYLGELEEYVQAKDVVEEAIELRRALYAAEPVTYRPALVASLHNLAIYLSELGHHQEARDVTLETVDLQRTLFSEDPSLYRFELAKSLHNLVFDLNALGSYSEAVRVEQEAALLLNRSNDILELWDKRIGTGSFGNVYLTKWKPSATPTWWDTTFYDQLVVKMLKDIPPTDKDLLTLPSVNRHFYREMIVSFRLGDRPHPNVVEYLGYITNSEGVGLVLPYFSGGNVLEYISATPTANREDLCRDVARGLRHLHQFSEPIIHGDLKPANVVVDSEGRAALCDFGLSRLRFTAHPTATLDGESPPSIRQATTNSSLSSTMRSHGTLRYCAHELLTGEGLPSLESDIYALACTCAEILTNQPPFSHLENSTDANIIDALFDNLSPYEHDGIIANHPNFLILSECWDSDPSKRPTATAFCQRMGW